MLIVAFKNCKNKYSLTNSFISLKAYLIRICWYFVDCDYNKKSQLSCRVSNNHTEVIQYLNTKSVNTPQKHLDKCNEHLYWETWAKDMGKKASQFTAYITKLINETKVPEFEEYLADLHKSINPSITKDDAITMLAQHMVSKPVFDALFEDYQFSTHNAISQSLDKIITLLTAKGYKQDTANLEAFNQSVHQYVNNHPSLDAKQELIRTLYDKFFKGAFPLTVEKLGIVYTPVQCVDFIIHSVNDLLEQEFQTNLSNEGVHILDPFVGTGTFITRLLQSKLIAPKDLERKYLHEIHCNEIILLAYYVADVNIENVYHALCSCQANASTPIPYTPYNGICLTDTFQLNEDSNNDIFSQILQANSERVEKQKKQPVMVIMGNPPYSAGQKNVNDNAQNTFYPTLEGKITETYAKASNAGLKKSLYDSYVKAIKWASDRIKDPANKQGGIIAYISNGSWLDSLSADGLRKCLREDFTSIYVLNLKGNSRLIGAQAKKEGDNIFATGTRTSITITFFVYNPAKIGTPATIYYHDIGDNLTREEKLQKLTAFHSLRQVDWRIIEPNAKQDWINQRDAIFDTLLPLANKKAKFADGKYFFRIISMGVVTCRDSFCYNSSSNALQNTMQTCVNFYNEQRKKLQSGEINDVTYDLTKISWSTSIKQHALQNTPIPHTLHFDEQRIASYRPFFKQHLYFSRFWNERVYQQPALFPTQDAKNIVICLDANSCCITNCIADLHYIGSNQCFPLYYYQYEEVTDIYELMSSADNNRYGNNKLVRKNGITDWILRECRQRYNCREITKEQIFYYVYGILHSKQYRQRFHANLCKELPHLPLVAKLATFLAFAKAGRQLAHLHLDYETIPPYPGVQVMALNSLSPEIIDNKEDKECAYQYYRVEKLKFLKKGVKDTIVYNRNLLITNIPLQAYDYIIHGRSAIEWLLDRYQVTLTFTGMVHNFHKNL